MYFTHGTHNMADDYNMRFEWKMFCGYSKMKVQSFSERNRKIACVEHDKIKD